MTVVDLLQASPVTFISACLILGLLIGSFLNVVIYRLPIMMHNAWKAECSVLEGNEPDEQTTFNLNTPRSACPHCGHNITAIENIPVVSYLFLKGKCRECKTAISPRYPLIELLTGLLSAVVAYHFGFSLACLGALLLTWSLVALTFIDIDHQLLPDSITLPLVWFGLFFNLNGAFTSLEVSVIGAMAGYLSLWLVFHAFKLITGKEGMGYGDFKLLAALGAWLGWTYLPVIILLSSFVGAIVGITLVLLKKHQQQTPIPFGPYLAAAGWLALIWGDTINRAYLGFTGL
jgi:leader peptidase (prepilin peptidase)/N-methyltransferase